LRGGDPRHGRKLRLRWLISFDARVITELLPAVATLAATVIAEREVCHVEFRMVS
jgi:hypothetical protein